MCGPGVPVGCGGQTADLGAHKKPLMCGPGVPVGCKSGHKKPLMCGAGWLSVWRAWRVLRVWRVWSVLGRANGRLGCP